MTQQLINNNTRINSVFHVLTDTSLLLLHLAQSRAENEHSKASNGGGLRYRGKKISPDHEEFYLSSHLHYPGKGMSSQPNLHCSLLSSALGKGFCKHHLRTPGNLQSLPLPGPDCKECILPKCRLRLFKMKERYKEHFTLVSKYLHKKIFFKKCLGQLQIAMEKDWNSTRLLTWKCRNCGPN